jgi:hypothetical protein
MLTFKVLMATISACLLCCAQPVTLHLTRQDLPAEDAAHTVSLGSVALRLGTPKLDVLNKLSGQYVVTRMKDIENSWLVGTSKGSPADVGSVGFYGDKLESVGKDMGHSTDAAAVREFNELFRALRAMQPSNDHAVIMSIGTEEVSGAIDGIDRRFRTIYIDAINGKRLTISIIESIGSGVDSHVDVQEELYDFGERKDKARLAPAVPPR